jgi:hypothetical protein
VLNYQNQGLLESEKLAYLEMLKQIEQSTNVLEVLLYTIARPSFQPEAVNIAKLEAAVMEVFADEIRDVGFQMAVNY